MAVISHPARCSAPFHLSPGSTGVPGYLNDSCSAVSDLWVLANQICNSRVTHHFTKIQSYKQLLRLSQCSAPAPAAHWRKPDSRPAQNPGSISKLPMKFLHFVLFTFSWLQLLFFSAPTLFPLPFVLLLSHFHNILFHAWFNHGSTGHDSVCQYLLCDYLPYCLYFHNWIKAVCLKKSWTSTT